MLTYEQAKAIERAIGPEQAGPLIQVLETMDERVKASMSHELATKTELRQEMAAVRQELAVTKAELQASIESAKADMIKWGAGMLIAQAALVAALVKLL